jgi:hypothetical protein
MWKFMSFRQSRSRIISLMTSCTAEQLLADAERILGRRPSYPWLRTLIRDGHLSHPNNRGIGGGGREQGTWPQSQRELFLNELQWMKCKVARADVCNLPVAWWLYIDLETPTKQIKLALNTWAQQRHKTSKRLARQTAAGIAEQFAGNPGFVLDRRSRDAFVKETAAVAGGGELHGEQLIRAARVIQDPDGGRGSVGPDGAQLSPEGWVGQIQAMRAGIGTLAEVSDPQLEDARERHLDHMDDYIGCQPEFASDRQIGCLFEPVTIDWLVSNACAHVVIMLGCIELDKRRPLAAQNRKSRPRPSERPGRMARGGRAPHAEQHASARRSPPRDRRRA